MNPDYPSEEALNKIYACHNWRDWCSTYPCDSCPEKKQHPLLTDPDAWFVRGFGIEEKPMKTRYDLLPADALEELALVYNFGVKKHGDERAWESGTKWSKHFGAIMRHAWAWMRGET